MFKICRNVGLLFFSLLFMNAINAETNIDHNNTQWPTTLSSYQQQHELKFVGNAVYSVLFWDLYKSQLSTSSGQYSELSGHDDLIYKIEYLKDVSAVDLVEYTIEQWQHLAINEQQYKDYLPQLTAIWPNIKAGDSLALVVQNNSSAFYYNGELLGAMTGEHFATLFLDIWLSKNTSEPKLRAQLLGRTVND